MNDVVRVEDELRRCRWAQALRVLGATVVVVGAGVIVQVDQGPWLLAMGVAGAFAVAVYPVGRRARRARLVLAERDRLHAERVASAVQAEEDGRAFDELEAKAELDAFLKEEG